MMKPFCDFCDKSNDKVSFMIAAPGDKSHICDKCVELCMKIIEDKRKEKANDTTV